MKNKLPFDGHGISDGNQRKGKERGGKLNRSEMELEKAVVEIGGSGVLEMESSAHCIWHTNKY